MLESISMPRVASSFTWTPGQSTLFNSSGQESKWLRINKLPHVEEDDISDRE
jgi:hypothetical protein